MLRDWSCCRAWQAFDWPLQPQPFVCCERPQKPTGNSSRLKSARRSTVDRWHCEKIHWTRTAFGCASDGGTRGKFAPRTVLFPAFFTQNLTTQNTFKCQKRDSVARNWTSIIAFLKLSHTMIPPEKSIFKFTPKNLFSFDFPTGIFFFVDLRSNFFASANRDTRQSIDFRALDHFVLQTKPRKKKKNFFSRSKSNRSSEDNAFRLS